MADTALLIADIGGYTRFLKENRFAAAHAHESISKLLESVIDAAKPLKVAKLEGDAAFLYAPVKSPQQLQALTKQVGKIRAAFLKRRESIANSTLCNCQACTEVGNLRLKFVAHAGDVSFQKVKRFTELAGVDVILVHRMLKNDVPVPEYVLMTDAVQQVLDPDLQKLAQPLKHDFEGLGDTDTWFINLEAVTPPVPAVKARPKAWLRVMQVLSVFKSLPLVLGIVKPCAHFRNVEFIDRAALPDTTGSKTR